MIKDNINCVDCGKNSLINVGGEYCPNCNSKNLQWNEPKEINVKE